MKNATSICIVAALFLVACSNDDMATPDDDDNNIITFNEDVLPILSQNGCTSCHGSTLAENGLRVNTIAGLLAGGNSGPAIVPGNAGASLIIQKMSASPPFGDRMPLDRPPVPDAQQNIIRQWINEGAQ